MSSPQPAASASGKGKIIGAVIALVIVGLFIFAYATVLSSYHKEGEKQTAAIREQAAPAPDHVEVIATVISADPVGRVMTVRMDLIPHGALTNDEGASPAENLTLLVNSSTGKREHVFEKGKMINPVDVVVDLVGQASDYPFDKHQGQLAISLVAPVKKEEARSSNDSSEEAEPPKDKKPESSTAEIRAVPIAIDFAGSLHGLKMEAEKNTKESNKEVAVIDVSISRAPTVKFFSVFVMILMWCLALTILTMALLFWLKKRSEFNTLAFYGGMLFAFPAFRGTQPAVPPLGTYSDYLAFFWAEAIVAISVIITVVVLLMRRPAAKS